MPHDDILIRDAEEKDIDEIHNVLAEAFAPYRREYTKEAYDATVVSKEEIRKRIKHPDMAILVAESQDVIVGTAVLEMTTDEPYIQSMAVKPSAQRGGVGISILKTIEKCAREMHARALSLECFKPLTEAIHLYERFGFKRTGRKRPYHGITIFEMKKTYLQLLHHQYWT